MAHMSVNFDKGSIPIEYDGHDDMMVKLSAALDQAISNGWIDQAEKKRHLAHMQDLHDDFLAWQAAGCPEDPPAPETDLARAMRQANRAMWDHVINYAVSVGNNDMNAETLIRKLAEQRDREAPASRREQQKGPGT